MIERSTKLHANTVWLRPPRRAKVQRHVVLNENASVDPDRTARLLNALRALSPIALLQREERAGRRVGVEGLELECRSFELILRC